jgi:nuclear pore complex protein Nup205
LENLKGGVLSVPIKMGDMATNLYQCPEDTLSGLTFLNFFSSVVTHPTQARVAIYSHPQYCVIASLLITLALLGIPFELKGAIFNTIPAFC